MRLILQCLRLVHSLLQICLSWLYLKLHIKHSFKIRILTVFVHAYCCGEGVVLFFLTNRSHISAPINLHLIVSFFHMHLYFSCHLYIMFHALLAVCLILRRCKPFSYECFVSCIFPQHFGNFLCLVVSSHLIFTSQMLAHFRKSRFLFLGNLLLLHARVKSS